jgi:polar amino acid transport system substrate-binding protein
MREMKTVKLGFDVPYEPFGMLVDGKPVGMMVDLVGTLLTRAGVAHEFVTMPLADTEPALLSGAVDGLVFKGITPARQAIMDFSAPLIVSGGAAFVRKGGVSSSRLADYAGKSVVTTREGPLWRQIEALQPDIRLVAAAHYEDALESVLAGTADMAALNRVVAIALIQRRYRDRFELPADPFIPLSTGFAVRKGTHGELLATVNVQLERARADGTWQRIHDRWLGCA